MNLVPINFDGRTAFVNAAHVTFVRAALDQNAQPRPGKVWIELLNRETALQVDGDVESIAALLRDGGEPAANESRHRSPEQAAGDFRRT
jgi:hypothetical protein